MTNTDSPFFKNIEEFSNESLYSNARDLLESYAEGGMKIMVDELFASFWDGLQLNGDYDEYLTDLAEFVLAERVVIPF